MPPRKCRPYFVGRLIGPESRTELASANRDVKVHALVLVLVDGAPQLVGALLEGHREGSRLAGLNGGRGLLVDARPFDCEIVRSRRLRLQGRESVPILNLPIMFAGVTGISGIDQAMD